MKNAIYLNQDAISDIQNVPLELKKEHGRRVSMKRIIMVGKIEGGKKADKSGQVDKNLPQFLIEFQTNKEDYLANKLKERELKRAKNS